METIKAIYDNHRKTRDRYTVVLNKKDLTKVNNNLEIPYHILALSTDPNEPKGISYFSSAIEGDYLGEKISLESLPIKLQKHIQAKLM